VFLENEREFSAYNFEHADTERLFRHFADAEAECQALLAAKLPLPAYDQCIKASHRFNLLDARGVISVTERAAYIGRIRNISRSVAQSYLESRARLGFPMAPRAWADEVVARLDKDTDKKAA
jgi:glycyl-tRNA synthetase alpha chain